MGISTIKIAFYTGLLFSSPFAIGQLILFLLPGLTKKETKIILPLLISSLILLYRISISNSYYSNFSWIIKYRLSETNVRCLAICHIDFNHFGSNFNTFN